jgi:hypothetical protein
MRDIGYLMCDTPAGADGLRQLPIVTTDPFVHLAPSLHWRHERSGRRMTVADTHGSNGLALESRDLCEDVAAVRWERDF